MPLRSVPKKHPKKHPEKHPEKHPKNQLRSTTSKVTGLKIRGWRYWCA
jgi:hypothetical protein